MGADQPGDPVAVSLDEPAARSLPRTGGKGASLARLVDAEFDVPRGFCVTTAAYRALVADPELADRIAALSSLDPGDADRIGTEAGAVRDRIRDRPFPDAVRDAVDAGVASVGADAYAVRSSATAEDLPTASFAGQHETFLAVRPAAVLDRVRECMASLFTDRAVAYRLRNDVDHGTVAMAVVVQSMVEPDVAGVLFTADPVTGNRHVASVDASFGLGDAVVAGEVTPDTVRVDRRTGAVLEYDVGEKDVAIRSRAGDAGGTESVAVPRPERADRALTDDQLGALVDLGGRIEALFEAPQDIEWALVDDAFVVLQSRPITALYPLPSPRPADDRLHVYLSFGHQQAMPAALPPLVVDFWRNFLNGAGHLVRPPSAPDIAVEAGNRVYLDFTPLLRLRPFRAAIQRAIGAMSEPAADGLRALLDRRGAAIPPRGRLAGGWRILRGLVRAAPRLRTALPVAIARFVRSLAGHPPPLDDQRRTIEGIGVALADEVRHPTTHAGRVRAAFDRFDAAVLVQRISPRMTPFPAAVQAGEALAGLLPDADDDLDAVGKGFEDEIVTRMNQQLGELADRARASPAVADALDAEMPFEAIAAVEGGPAFVDAFDAFLDEFGHRATGEIDLSRPRWAADPATLLGTIRSNLAHDDPGGHRAHLDRLEREAEAAAARLETLAGRGLLGPVRRRLVRRLLRAYRGGLPLREYPKQGIAHLFAAIHEVVSAAGAALAADGRLARPDDVWFLRKDELLAALETEGPIDVDVAARRRDHARFAGMAAPALLTSEGERPADRGGPPTDGTLTGTPVSAGVVEGPARVVLDPAGASIEAGEILVAPATDPGWTPLFLNIAGLVMEVGGRMTHGALVAREYGIPAVASVPAATTAIRTGERIRIDGTRGTVERLDRTAQAERA